MKNKKIIYWCAIFILVIIIIIMSIILYKKNKNQKSLDTNEIINLASEKYIQEKFLDHDLLSIFTAAYGESRNIDNMKIQYTLGYYMKNHNIDNVTEEQFLKTYKEIFGEDFNLNVKLIDKYQPYYTYNIQDGRIYLKDSGNIQINKENKEYSYKILGINKEGDIYKLNISVLNNDEDKVSNAILILKIIDNNIVFVDYEESIE